MPFAWLPDRVGGSAWVILDIVAMAGACVLATRLIGAAPGWAGIGFGLFSFYPWALSTLLGNINPLVLFLVLLLWFAHLLHQSSSTHLQLFTNLLPLQLTAHQESTQAKSLDW